MAISTAYSTALSGLSAHQSALEVTSNNISNASNPDYVRERAVFSTLEGIKTTSGVIGIGVEIKSIKRITDTFLFNRFSQTSANFKYFETKEQYLKEISTYFPDVNDEGLYQDIKEFFNAWQDLASNPNDGAVKVDLANKTIKLTDSIKSLREMLDNIKNSIDEEIKTRIDEANSITKEIASINQKINSLEADGKTMANELRDKRDSLEKRLKEILDVKVFKSAASSDVQGDVSVDFKQNYQLSINGYPLLENTTYNQLEYNGKIILNKTDITSNITGGEVGAFLDFNKENGIIDDIISTLDALSQGLIRSVNSIYSYSAQENVQTDTIQKPITISDTLANKPLNMLDSYLKHPVRDGKLKLNIYDDNGEFTKEVEISIDSTKSLNYNLDKINDALSNAGVETQAKLINGEIKFVDKNNNEAPNVLVKDDGSLLFSALNEIEYLPLSKVDLPIPLEDGSFDIVVYDDNANTLAKRTITIDKNSLNPKYSTIQGILSQINTPNIDDNADNNPNNDVDDYYKASFINGKFYLTKNTTDNIYVGLDNDSANFGGSFGINKFFDGSSSKDISLNKKLQEDPSQIHANKTPSEGDNEVANEILNLQFEEITFYKNSTPITNTISGFYRSFTTNLANQTSSVSEQKETTNTLLTSISNEYYSLSGVNIDEELINLEKFQRGYQANAKVITTINEMLDTLFGIKQ